MSAGYEHTVNGIVYRTFAAPTNEVRVAALKTLHRMAMPVTVDKKSEEGWALSAKASKRTIDIELQALTEPTTRMRVVANDGAIFFKDASTATEIINRTVQIVQDDRNTAKTGNQRNSKKSTS